MTNSNSDRTISREAAAAHIGVTVHEMKRRQSLKQLRVVRRGVRGQVFYDFNQVEALRLRREGEGIAMDSAIGNAIPFTAEEATQVFQELKAGASAVDCVLKLSVHPSKVEAIIQAYGRLTNTLVFNSEEMDMINELPLDGTFPITKASAILGLLKNGVKEKPCGICFRRPKHLCKACAIPFVQKKLERDEAISRTRQAQEAVSGDADEVG